MVDNIIIETYYSKLPEETMASVMQAIQNRQYFALRREKSMVIFCIIDRKSIFLNYAGVMASYDYPDEEAFINAVRIQLITHREFVSREVLLHYIDQKLLT